MFRFFEQKFETFFPFLNHFFHSLPNVECRIESGVTELKTNVSNIKLCIYVNEQAMASSFLNFIHFWCISAFFLVFNSMKIRSNSNSLPAESLAPETVCGIFLVLCKYLCNE